MANKYCYSGAAGAGTGADWANAYTTLTAALAGAAAGDDIWIASDHLESTAGAVTLTGNNTNASPNRVISVNRGGSVPPVAADITAGAIIRNTTSANISVNALGLYAEGLIFEAGSAASGTATIATANVNNAIQIFNNCKFRLLSTGTSSRISVCSNAGSKVVLIASQMKFQNVSQSISLVGYVDVRCNGGNLLESGSAVPTSFADAGFGRFVISGADLSDFGSGKTLFPAGVNGGETNRLLNCKLGASVTVAATPTKGRAAGSVEVIGCSSTTNVERNERYLYQGTLTTETTIVRTGGASDGTTAYSWKVVTTANPRRDDPFETFEGVLWNDVTGASKTLTAHIVTDNVTLTDAEAWLEVEYLGSSATPVASLVTDANATVLTTAANQDTSTETWTTTGLTTPVKQKLNVSFTPQMAGPIRWRAKVAKASTTVYIDPKVELS